MKLRTTGAVLALVVTLAAPMPATAKDIVPLRRGFYVRADVSCDRASKATLTLFTGKAFGAQCKAEDVAVVKPAKGARMLETQVGQTCRDSGYVSRDTRLYRIANDHEFVVAIADQEIPYRLCPQDELPPPWSAEDLSALQRCADLE
ncbi:hypothetical protein [Magnetospirillum aberrantis]|uniref:DUF3617 family protein n=1 Tax=Magnetospirillum aberrantis SpK TaxID=908842 RepID=A0A7C9QVJ2_9PROT|nr:hypothetical protein [Magnetospirillum aberrantis]NFV81660.1 hypothetical protein [Magnetospirillum aberrantis SpK]